MTEDPKPFSASELAGFIGTEIWYRHSFIPGVTYTEGVHYLAERAGAYWLIDKIATLQLTPKIRAEAHQSWKLIREGHSAARLTCDDGDGNVVHREKIDFTDFPLEEITLYAIQGATGDGTRSRVIMLTSEY